MRSKRKYTASRVQGGELNSNINEYTKLITSLATLPNAEECIQSLLKIMQESNATSSTQQGIPVPPTMGNATAVEPLEPGKPNGLCKKKAPILEFT